MTLLRTGDQIAIKATVSLNQAPDEKRIYVKIGYESVSVAVEDILETLCYAFKPGDFALAEGRVGKVKFADAQVVLLVFADGQNLCFHPSEVARSEKGWSDFLSDDLPEELK